jgi:aerobic carbon-monoxide dehydrogenase large subunit
MPDDISLEHMKFAVGQRVLRTEDPRLLTGGGQYTDDTSLPGQAYLVLVRSTVAHGEIKSIDTAAAKKAPGVLGVWVGKDLEADGIGGLPCAMPLKSRDGKPLIVPYRPPIAVGRVRHVGDPIAAVVAETLAQAKDAAELIEVDIAPLPAVLDAAEADKPGAPLLFDNVPNNLCLDYHDGNAEKTAEAFKNAAHVTRLRLDNNKVVVNAMEPRAALATYENGKYTIYTGSQGVVGLRNSMAANVLKTEPKNLRVISNDVGGSFGMKGQPYSEAIASLYAAKKLGRPVKWVADRSESFLADHQGRASIFDCELALDKEGNFLGLRLTGYGDMGAYLTAMGPGPSAMVLSRNIISVYKTPVVSVSTKCVFTNTVPTGPYRGAGRPESKYIMERLIDQAARETGIDRIELRRKNLIPKSAMPYNVPIGIVYDSGDFVGCLDKAVVAADVRGFTQRKADAKSRGKLRGLGIACYLETTAPAGVELGDIRFNDNGTVSFITGSRDFGMGHRAPMQQLLSQQLGIPFDKITVIQNDSDLMIGGGGSGGSRTMISTGGAALEAAGQVVDKGKKLAAHALEVAAEDVEWGQGRFRIAGTDRSIGLLELAKLRRERKDWPADLPEKLDSAVVHKTSPSSYPNGCHVCEVEIDPDTGVVSVLKHTVVDDFGVMVNPMIVEGQVHGGVAQGLGIVLAERTVYDEDGQLLTGSFVDYAIPRAEELPSIKFDTNPVPCTTNPIGAKGCGEAGVAGSLPSGMCAVLDALWDVGVRHLDTPATPARVWQAIKDAKRS